MATMQHGKSNPGNDDGKRGRFRVSSGGILIPIAILGAISAFETARTTDASREVFWNIKTPWLMYMVFGISVTIILGAFIQRMRVWRLGKPQSVFDNIGARLTNALTMGAGTSRVKNDRFAGRDALVHLLQLHRPDHRHAAPRARRLPSPHLPHRPGTPVPEGPGLPGLQPRRRPLRRDRSRRCRHGGLPSLRQAAGQAHLGPPQQRRCNRRRAARRRALHGHLCRRPANRRRGDSRRQRELVEVVSCGLRRRENLRLRQRRNVAQRSRRLLVDPRRRCVRPSRA